MKLYDPVTGIEVDLYSSRAESSEVWRCEPESVIRCLMAEYGVSESEVVKMLCHSDVDAPVIYRDQVFWVN